MEPENHPVRVAAGLGLASGPGELLAADYDLLLSIFPFEKDWYARRVPNLRVEFVGHPMVERFAKAEGRRQSAEFIRATVDRRYYVAGQPEERIATAFAGDAGRVEIDSVKITGFAGDNGFAECRR